VRRWVGPWTPEDHAVMRDDLVDIAAECALAPPPPGRIWLLRSPWATIAVDVVLHLIGLHCEERGLMLVPEGFTTAARELLGRDEDLVWVWWPGLTGTIARAWRQQGRFGPEAAPVVLAELGPDDVRALRGHGLTESQAVAWAQALGLAGADAVEEVPRWRALGLPADPPPELADLTGCLTIPQLRAWLAAGFSLDAVRIMVGTDVTAATRWRAAGLSAAQTRQVVDADPTLREAELRAFDTAGIDWLERLAWIDHGFDAAAADQWRRLGVTPMLARVWRSAGLTARDAVTRTGPGDEIGLPPGVQVGWYGYGDDPGERHYGVQDPPGTRGSIARQQRARER